MTIPTSKGILIVDAEVNAVHNIREFLTYRGYSDIHCAHTMQAGKDILAATGDEIYAVILGLLLPDGFGLDMVEYLNNTHPYIIGIILTSGGGDLKMIREFYDSSTYKTLTSVFMFKPIELDKFCKDLEWTIQSVDDRRQFEVLLREYTDS